MVSVGYGSTKSQGMYIGRPESKDTKAIKVFKIFINKIE
jgi:hypothetical protein